MSEILTNLGGLSSEETEHLLDQFSMVRTLENVKTSTQPSAVAFGDSKEIGLTKLNPIDIEKYLWMHGAVPRGIQIKANRMTGRGYSIRGTNNDYLEYCKRIINNSGDTTDLNQWIQDTFAFGDGYRTLVLNEDESEVVAISPEHPIYFDIAKYPDDYKNKALAGKYKISETTKTPLAYTQIEWNDKEMKFVPVGNEIPADRVAHLIFDKWGDEVKGISIVQYIHTVIKYLLNIEEAGAETMWRNGFVQKKVTTDITTEKDLRRLGKSLAGLNARDVVILPNGSDVNNLLPGTSQFKEFHDVFLTLVAIRLGIPKPLLTLDGTSTNKATIDSQKKDMRDDLKMDENIIQQIIKQQIFIPACKIKYGDSFDLSLVPEFKFNDVSTDTDTKINQLKDISTYSVQFANVISMLHDMGRTREATDVLQVMMAGMNDEYLLNKVEPFEKKEVVSKQNGKGQLPTENARVPPASKELKAGNDSKD